MRDDRASRQSRSARHYLTHDALTDKLLPTLSLAARTLGFSSAMVNILDEHHQHTIAVLGGDFERIVAREEAFCDVVVASDQSLVVSDASLDHRFADLPPVVDGVIRSYIGVPLHGREALSIGAVCVTDPQVLEVDGDQVARLEQFGKVVEDQLDLIRRLHDQRRSGEMATDELATAISNGDIAPWYQSIVDLRTGGVIGYEALARWRHPSGRIWEPNSFVPLAEDSDLIIDVDLAVLRQAMLDLRRWQQHDPSLRMSINVSARHFDHPDWLAPILAATREAGVSPSTVDIELTETARLSFEHPDGSYVQELQQHGFQVWLDDFGTGWSSLEYLLRLPADGLKIDRVISVAIGNRIGDALVRSVIELAHELGMRTTIEGVESAAVARRAARLHCDYAQGYLWSEPVPASEVDAGFQVHPIGSLPAEPEQPFLDDAAASVADAPAFLDGAVAVVDDSPAFLDEAVGTSSTGTRRPGDDAIAGAVLDAIPDPTAVLDEDGMIVAVNHAWRMYTIDNGGSDATSGVGVNYLQTCVRAAERGSAEAAQVAHDIRSVLSGRIVETEMEYACPSPGVRRWFLLRITRLSGAGSGVVTSHINITRRKMAEEELAHAASHDPLTGLANRTRFQRQLSKALATRPDRSRSPDVAVLYIDLDGFKAVNDTYGHAAGDEVLMEVAHRLRESVRPGCTVARLGGDEFAIIAPRTNPLGLTTLASRISDTLAEPHHVHGSALSVPGSIGTHLAASGDDAMDALALADRAMYTVKRQRQLA